MNAKPTSLPQPSKDPAATGRAQIDLLAADPDLQKDAEARIREIEQGHVPPCTACDPPPSKQQQQGGPRPAS